MGKGKAGKGKSKKGDGFWAKGHFAKPISEEEMKRMERTIHLGHDEKMDFNCRTCKVKISAHNKDWHDGMCDGCFYKTYFPDE